MTEVLLSKLRHTLAQLKPLATDCYTPADQETLRALLDTTITNLHTLYPDHLSAQQKHDLLQNLAMLEQQADTLAATETAAHPCPEWRAINSALRAAIINVLPE